MSRRLELSASAIYPLLDWFIPASIPQDGESQQRARMFLISHLFGPFLGHTITVYLYLLDPAPGIELWLLAFSITAFWLFPFALRLTGWYTVLALLSVQNLTFATLWGSYNYGGTSSPFLPWLLTVPLLAFFYLGPAKKLRLLVLGLIAVNLSVFYVLYAYGGDFPERIPRAELEDVGIISTMCAAVYVSMMALYYANIVASQSELEREVNSHRATATKLLDAKEEAERANQAKSEFLARMSHELRTPLNAVIGYSEMLREDAEIAGRAEQMTDLDKIHSSGKHLLNLVTGILDLAKIEAGKMELFTEPVNVASLVREVSGASEGAAAENGNTLAVACGDDLGTITCDAAKLRQALSHLVSNAVKFTHDGSITVAAERHAIGRNEWVSIAVRDTGIGIHRDHLPSLFQNFGEAETSTSSKYGGTGLGLSLSRKLCQLMGGEITVESEPGRGSCFTIRLPTEKTEGAVDAGAADAAVPAAGEPQRQPHRVLVIDDDLAALDLTHRILVKEGFQVILAADPQEGISLARTAKPSVVILDVVMRAMNGWDVLRAIKQDPETADCPAVMLTVLDDRKAALELGAADHLTKPVDRDALLQTVRRLCAGAAGRQRSGVAAREDRMVANA